MKIKDFARLDLNGEHNRLGRIFVDPGTAEIVDLSKVKILACSVDTVRQLYRGLIRPEIMCLHTRNSPACFAVPLASCVPGTDFGTVESRSSCSRGCKVLCLLPGSIATDGSYQSD